MIEDDIIRRAKTAISRFDSLRIVGAGWSGNSRQGFQFNPESGLAGAAKGTTPTPPPPTGCHGITTCTAGFTFAYEDSATFPRGHFFSGMGTVTLDVADCSGTDSQSVLVTVTEEGEFGTFDCDPQVGVLLSVSATYDSMSALWTVTAEVFLLDHSTVCPSGGWPVNSIISDINDTLTDSGGTLPLVPGTSPPLTGNVTFTFS